MDTVKKHFQYNLIMKIWIFSFLIFTTLFADIKNIKFQHITNNNGLSNNTVNCIIKDKFGFMWFATNDGLNKYDGYELEIFKHQHNNLSTIKGNQVYAIGEDHRGIIWIGTTVGLSFFDPVSNSIVNDKSLVNYPDVLSKAVISNIMKDKNNNMWISTNHEGLFFYDRKSGNFENFRHDPEDTNSISENYILSLFEDSRGNIWIGTNTQGLDLYNPEDNSFVHFNYNAEKNSIPGNSIMAITEDTQSNLWIGASDKGSVGFDGGVSILNLNQINTPVFKPLKINTIDLSVYSVQTLMADQRGGVWIGLENYGLIYYKKAQDQQYYQQLASDPYSLNNNSFKCMYQDEINDIWIGTFAGGVNVIHYSNQAFKYFKNNGGDPNSLSSNNVKQFAKDSKGNVWIATDGGGLNKFHQKTGTFKRYNTENSDIINDAVTSVWIDKQDKIYIGTWDGLSIYDINQNTFQSFNTKNSALKDNNIQDICEDAKDRIWFVADGGGLNRYDKKEGKIINVTDQYDFLEDYILSTVYASQKGEILFGGHSGLKIFNPDTKYFKSYDYDRHSPNSISHANIRCLYEENDTILWIGTANGLNKLNRNSGKFTYYFEEDGLPNNVVNGILQDNYGNLWISTYNGITKFNTENGQFKNYNIDDGLQGNQFNERSAFKSGNGMFFFGGLNGFNQFDPRNVIPNHYIPEVLITEFRLFNRAVSINDPESPLTKNILLADKIILKPDQTFFTLEFTALNYVSSKKNQYAYILEGLDHDWNYVGHQRTATYTDVKPGKYIFKVKAANNDGVWNEEGASVRIEILPPFWMTSWALAIYIVFSIVSIYLLILWIKKRTRQKYYKLHIEKQHQLDQMKLQFFTNISHEFRTPLTLIINPLEKLIHRNSKLSQSTRHLYDVMLRNSKRLLLLVNQLMDFQKLSEQKMDIQLSHLNIGLFIKSLVGNFQFRAAEKHLQLDFYSEEEIIGWVDSDKLEKIMYNLLSNAIKYTPDYGKITVSVKRAEDQRFILISVRDTGIGIPEKDRENIFQPFYQVDGKTTRKHYGTGIGLALVKELITTMKGTISLESEPGKGSRFLVNLTIDRNLYDNYKNNSNEISINKISDEYDKPEQKKKQEKDSRKDQKAATILITEDDPDLRFFIKDELSKNYRTLEAFNGKIGLEMAINKLPDLIISDVMMPEMDGFEMCAKLKTNPETSHIPVIILTARSGEQHHEKGYEIGADEYITKPFSTKFLKLRIESLLKSRANLSQKFRQKVYLEPTNTPIDSQEETWLKEVVEIVEKKMVNPGFKVDDICEEIGMSRSSLFRKIKALTKMSPNNFIRSLRLKKAAHYIENSDYSIAEISYKVGFSDPSYFSKQFKKYFKIPPSDYPQK